ncbi:uncharacterized protein C1orf43 homolog isoform X2 [Nasonia vitripennis]|uniref:Uncharacterized protein n=1 Tax=Nasonia vitripennis TaxID=7425 RepID=A0A7M7R350_NASVI|nr:uncharacterized protein C1orf43 homolog isoform X2 [Nasonia vitripennis]XP_032457454.1 uncharacterized protein C1orf43 homolog isoform X2 [Nasonia vitripennis]
MLQQLSGVNIVLFIAAGVQTVILLFIFAKRQIMRFTLRSRRGPHTPIAYDTIKSLRKEIDRRIHVIPRIQYEPYLDESIHKLMNEGPIPSHFYRLKAVNDFKKLELQINHQNNFFKRHPKENIRGYLINALSDNLTGNGQHMIHEFCDLYEHARHDPSEFQDEEYEIYSKLLLKLIDAYV